MVQPTPGERGVDGLFHGERQVDDEKLSFVSTHVDNRWCAAAGIGDGSDIDEARAAIQVGGDAGGHSSIIPGVNRRGAGLQAQVTTRRVHEQWVGIDIARPGVATLNVAVGDNRRAAGVIDLVRCVAPHDSIGQRGIAAEVVHPGAAAICRVAGESHV